MNLSNSLPKRMFAATNLKFGLLAILSLILNSTVTAEVYSGVDFPGGEASFADEVVSFTQGSNTQPPYNEAAESLGVPNDIEGDGIVDAVSLGNGGTLILRFTDNLLIASGDSAPDLAVFESGSTVESVAVAISADGLTWIDLGQTTAAVSLIDIDPFVQLNVSYSYVRLTDVIGNGATGAPYAGADIDAVGAITPAEPPAVVDAAASPSILWPPNHRMVTVTLEAEVESPVGEAEWSVVAIDCNEPNSGDDVQIVDDHTLNLRATRAGKGNGRVYTIWVVATDAFGNESEPVAVEVVVPHDQRNTY